MGSSYRQFSLLVGSLDLSIVIHAVPDLTLPAYSAVVTSSVVVIIGWEERRHDLFCWSALLEASLLGALACIW